MTRSKYWELVLAIRFWLILWEEKLIDRYKIVLLLSQNKLNLMKTFGNYNTCKWVQKLHLNNRIRYICNNFMEMKSRFSHKTLNGMEAAQAANIKQWELKIKYYRCKGIHNTIKKWWCNLFNHILNMRRIHKERRKL